MKKINLRKNNLGEILGFLIAVISMSLGVFYLVSDIKSNTGSLLQQRREIASVRANKEKVSRIKRKYSKELPEILKMRQMFVSKENPVPFIDFLEKLANEEGILFEIKSSFQDKEGNLVFNVSAISPYANLYRFLTKLEKGPYFVKVENLNIKRISQKDIEKKKEFSEAKEGDVNTKIIFTVYSLP